jgi:hypothetical protein
MASVTIVPDSIAAVNYDAWTISGGSTKHGNMSDASDSTTVFSTDMAELRQGFFWQDVPAAASIDSWTFTTRASNNTDNHPWRIYFRVSGADDDSNTQANFPIGSFGNLDTLHTDGFDLPKTPTNFNAAEVGLIRLATADPNALSVADFKNVVVYTPPSGGFVWLVSGWLPILMNVASHALTQSDILSILSSRRIRLEGGKHEYRQLIPTQPWEFSELSRLFLVRPRFAF